MDTTMHEVTRRSFLTSAVALSSAATMLPLRAARPDTTRDAEQPASAGWWVPAEAAPHRRCWMAWPVHEALWGAFLADVRRDVARVAQAIAQFEPVVMCVRPDQRAHAERLCGSSVEYFEVYVDDLWIRDTGLPSSFDGQGGLAGSTWNFKRLGDRQVHGDDAALASESWAGWRAPVSGAARHGGRRAGAGRDGTPDLHGVVLPPHSHRNPGT
jgi:agmatine deiminase